MKIKRLIVSKYKNVQNLNLKFGGHLISLLVGRNGLGKSNLIEILALIFRDLDLLQTEEDFKSWSYQEGHFEFFIQYECKNSELKILCREEKFRVFRKQINTTNVFVELEFPTFKERKTDDFLPDFIIGYYSGENKRVKNIIRAYEENVWQDLKLNRNLDKPLRRLFFSENHHAQMILLTLLLYKGQTNDPDFQTKSNELINRFCSFKDLDEFNLILKQPSWFIRTRRGMSQLSIENLEENLLDDRFKENPFWGIRGKADQIITYFYNNSETHNGYFDLDNPRENERVEKLVLKGIDKINIAASVFSEFGHPSNFFASFETLYQIESVHTINLKVTSKQRDLTFDFSQLSEGEQQLITVLGLILITGRADCLFLLDEPDTHLNPIWQREYVNLLTDFNLNDINSHIIVATHSPLIVQAAERADIFLYKEAEEKIMVENNSINIHNWRIDQVLTSEYFELKSSRPAQLDQYMELRGKILEKPRLTDADSELLKQFENQFGVLPTGETIDEIRAILLINRIADKIPDKE